MTSVKIFPLTTPPPNNKFALPRLAHAQTHRHTPTHTHTHTHTHPSHTLQMCYLTCTDNLIASIVAGFLPFPNTHHQHTHTHTPLTHHGLRPPHTDTGTRLVPFPTYTRSFQPRPYLLVY